MGTNIIIVLEKFKGKICLKKKTFLMLKMSQNFV